MRCSRTPAPMRMALIVSLLLLAGSTLHAAPNAALHTDDSLEIAHKLSDAFANVAEAIEPSVVSITTTREVRMRGRTMMPDLPEPFRRFFDDDFFRGPQVQPQPRSRIQRGQGSGFVVSPDGYIVTNNHVVDGADEITVRFTDNRSHQASVVGTDPQTDIAILKIDASGLTPLPLGDSDALRVGQIVIAAGSPFGLTSTITTGVVSATGRSRVGITDYEDFIQTDAAINPGNSGGPLVNLRGEAIGVNSAIVTRSGGFHGVGFAIPINMVKSIKDALIEEGRVVRGYLGVQIQDLTEDLARSFGFDGAEGVLVAEVQPDTPADEAGFRSGDIITHLNGRRVADTADLRLRVASIQPGTDVQVRVHRDGRSRTLTATVDRLPGADAVASADSLGSIEDELGVTVRSLTRELAERLGLKDFTAGVVIEEVDQLGPAARAGMRAGDVIVSVQNEPVRDVEEFEDAMRRHDLSEGVRFTIRSRGGSRFVFIRTG